MLLKMKRLMPVCGFNRLRFPVAALALIFSAVAAPLFGQTNPAEAASTNVPGWITQPLSLVDALNLTLQQNSGLKKARADLESSRGLVIQTRAVAMPSIAVNGNVTRSDPGLIEQFPFTQPAGAVGATNFSFLTARDTWDGQVRI